MSSNNGAAARSIDTANSAVAAVSADLDSLHELRREVAELARTLPAGLRRITVRAGERQIEIEWSGGDASAGSDIPGPRRDPAPPAVADGAADAGWIDVRAPLVGCYFAASAPDAAPFVRVGDQVEAHTTVAIIEAMKMMNQIEAGINGVVTEVAAVNGESVEYDQVLVRIRPGDGVSA